MWVLCTHSRHLGPVVALRRRRGGAAALLRGAGAGGRVAPMGFETILYAIDGAVATITLNRPEQLNTIVPPMPDEVEAAVGARGARRRASR